MKIEIVVKDKNGQERPISVEDVKAAEIELGEKPQEEENKEKPKKLPYERRQPRIRYKPYEPYIGDSVPDGERWTVEVDGKFYMFRTQRRAVKFATLVAEDRDVDVTVHAPRIHE